MSFQKALAYRLEYFVSLTTSFLYIFIFTSVWATVSAESPDNLGTWTGTTLVSYAILTTIVKVCMSRNDQMIPNKIRNGDIIFDFLKPYSYPLAYAFDSLGGSIFQAFAKAIPLLIISILIYGISLVEYLPNVFLFLAFYSLGYILYLMVGYVLGSMAFFFTDVFGFYLLYYACTTLFSGAIIPVDLFPDLLKTITVYTPFPYFFYYPTSILMGRGDLPTTHYLLLTYISQIAFWLIICRIVYLQGRKKLEILGG
ncbi:MAG: ABC transporter permease [Leptospira sp.]|nr:ABC transporter permease [Leptospira sp.]